MKKITERAVSMLAVRAGRRSDAAARLYRSLVHALVLVAVADSLPLIVRCLEGIGRELKGI